MRYLVADHAIITARQHDWCLDAHFLLINIEESLLHRSFSRRQKKNLEDFGRLWRGRGTL